MITQLLQATNLLVFVITVTSPFGGPSVVLTSAQVVVPTISPAQPNPVAPFSTTNSNETSSDAPSDQPSDTPSLSPSTNPSSSPTYPTGVEANIVGGIKANTGEYPFFAWVNDDVFPCGGTLIFDDIIITAAHCGCDKFLNNPIYINGILRSGSDATEIAYASDCVVHPGYDSALRYDDIMLIKLESPSAVLPAEAYIPDTAETFESATVVGYGYTDYGDTESTFLRKLDSSILPDATCDAQYMNGDGLDPSFDPDYRTFFNLCAQSNFGSLCNGDGGGPLLTNGNVLVGIFSLADGTDGCGIAGGTAVYTQVSSYSEWILETACGTCVMLFVDSCHIFINFFEYIANFS